MKRKLPILPIVLFVAAFVVVSSLWSCDSGGPEQFPEVIKLDESVLTDTISMQGSIIEDSYNFVNAKDLYVYQDSVIVSVNNPSTTGYFVELYNLNTHSEIASYIRKGNGPGEMLLVSSCLSGDDLAIDDFAKHNIVAIKLSEAIENKIYKLPTFVYYGELGSSAVAELDSTHLVMLNPYFFYDKSHNIDNAQPRFLVWNVSNQEIEGGVDRSGYFAYNVNQAMLAINRDKSRIIRASTDLSEFGVYDIDLNPIRQVLGPLDLSARYYIDEADKSVCFHKNIPYSYMGVASTDDYVYLSYVGEYNYFEVEVRKKIKTCVLKFDWDGNFISSFGLGRYISTISVGSDETIYGEGYDDVGAKVLWKFIK